MPKLKLPADPDRINAQRAAWAHQALVKFQEVTGADACDAVADLMADLWHLCDREGSRYGTFADAQRRATVFYRDETRKD